MEQESLKFDLETELTNAKRSLLRTLKTQSDVSEYVLGAGIIPDKENPGLTVYLDRSLREGNAAPQEFEGFPVNYKVTGTIEAYSE